MSRKATAQTTIPVEREHISEDAGARGGQVEQEAHAVHRQCELLRENGERCRGIPALGETLCHAHRRYRESCGRMTLAVPLLEDEASILFVISQTVRAMAQGGLPPQNGQAMLTGCRLALRVLEHRLAKDKLALRRAAAARKAKAANPQPAVSGPEDHEPCTTESAEDTEKAVGTETLSQSTETAAELQSYPTQEEPRAAESHFPNVKKAWDRALIRTDGAIADVVTPHEGETWHDVVRRREILRKEALTETVCV